MDAVGKFDADQATLRGGVAAECEAFLTGNYAKLMASSGASVPLWAALNRIAHRSVRELLDDIGDSDPRWRELEFELIRLVSSSQARWEQLQTHYLVPIELRLAGDPAATAMSLEMILSHIRFVAQQVAPSLEG